VEDPRATTTRLILNGSIRNARYQHIIGWRRFLYPETQEDAILLYMQAACA
jgi:hypothetical protein